MSKAAELAALIGSQSALSNRNLIINGAMQVAQRGTSETGVTSGNYKNAPDRFRLEATSAGTWTVSQSTTAPEGFSNSYKFECTTANGSLSADSKLSILQRIEGQNLQHLKKGTSSAESITVSFWVRSSKTGTYIVQIKDQDNTRSYSQAYTISSANTWEYKTITYAGDTTGALDNDNGDSLRIFWWLVAGTDFTSGTLATAWESSTNANRAVGQINLADTVGNEWQITGVQLEVGETATPFEHRSYGDELARCQRYYEGSELSNPISWSGDVTNGNTYWDVISYTVEKRASPTITIGTEFAKNGFSGTPSTSWIREKSFRASANSNSTTNGAYFVFAFTADAEL